MDLSHSSWLLMVVVAMLVGVSKTGLPGIGILSVVLTVLATGTTNANLANGTLLIMLLTGDVFAVGWYRRHANWGHLVRLLPPAMIGIVAGYLLARALQQYHLEPQLARIIGGLVLSLLVLNRLWSARPSRAGQPSNQPASDSQPAGSPPRTGDLQRLAFAVAIGGLAGVTTMLANAAGPLLVIYLLAMRLDKHAFIGTSAWYFLLLNSFKVPFMASLGWITVDTLRIDLLMVPAVLAGALLGLVIMRHIPQRAFRVIVELLAAAGALKLAIG